MESVTADVWVLAGVLVKLLGLVALAGVTGGSFSSVLAQRLGFAMAPDLGRYLLANVLLGVAATSGLFLLQIGTVNQAGVAGMLDWEMAIILAQTNPGYVTGLRMLGFLCVVPAWLLWTRQHKHSGSAALLRTASIVCFAAAISLFGLSFGLIGHVSMLPMAARIAIVLHVLAGFLWIGSLYPLLRLSTDADVAKVQKLMQVFGRSALLIVGILLLSGIFLVTRLVQPFSELLTTPYGLTLLMKLAGFTGLLALAGINKLLLVPRLMSANSVHVLRTSIRAEMVITLLILLLTAWLTTAVGPAV